MSLGTPTAIVTNTIYGYVYDVDGVTPIQGAVAKFRAKPFMLDDNLIEIDETVTSDATGLYQVVLPVTEDVAEIVEVTITWTGITNARQYSKKEFISVPSSPTNVSVQVARATVTGDVIITGGAQGVAGADGATGATGPIGPSGGITDHTGLTSIGTNTHAQIDTKLANSVTHIADTNDDHVQYSKISSGAGAPGTTPSRVGLIYVDTTADDTYIAAGTASSADWKINGGGATVVRETLRMEDANTTRPTINTGAIAYLNTYTDTISTLGSYTNSATLGFTYTATVTHMVALTLTIGLSSGGTNSGITVDGDLTLNFIHVDQNGKRRCMIHGPSASRGFTGSVTTLLTAGQTIAGHTDTLAAINGQFYVNIVSLEAWSI